MIDMVTTFAALVLAVCIIMAAYRVIAGPSQAGSGHWPGYHRHQHRRPDSCPWHEIGSRAHVDAALVIALLAFLGTVALAKYLAGGTVIDRGDR